MIAQWLLEHFALGSPCPGNEFFGFPTWYHYLGSNTVNGTCAPAISGLVDIWLIVAAVIEILLRLAALVAVVFIIIGGVEFITSQGEPESTNKARNTAIDALIGLLITIIAATVVSFIAGSIK